MRRWNGWGDDTLDYPLNESALAFLAERIGESTPTRDASLEQVLGAVSESRLDKVSGFDSAAETRLRHARGQSFPDWLALRCGRIGPVPDAVAFPESHDDVARLLNIAKQRGAMVIPYGGGTSVVGHLNVPAGERPVLSLDLGRVNRLMQLDPVSRLARFGAGVAGPDLEAQLRAQGYVLGHLPQSFEYSTLGGWVVTRSSGQQSLKYGRIEQLFAGGRMLTPAGTLEIPTIPASSAGPDLREWVMGSEGRFGVLTEAQVRITPVSECEGFHAVFFPSWEQGSTAVRELAQAKLPLSMLRLSNAIETETQLALAGHPDLIAWLQRYLGLRGVSAGQCMLLIGITGDRRLYRYAKGSALSIACRHKGVHVGRFIGKGWSKNRFRGPYLRNTLWQAGYAADTIETSVDWPRVTTLMQAMEKAAREAFAACNERVHAFTHLSHVYPQGSSIYSTFVFRACSDPDEMMERWRRLKTRVSEQIVAQGGTISHQHGVGVDHAPYLAAEKTELGLGAIRAVAKHFDPDGMMNPGKLFQ
jgi:alkyldihydroxyacetonephosphate synthase